MSYCFFLGGHDLEMLEIKKILLALGYTEGGNLFDKNLHWGAKLSDYAADFRADAINVCIELTEDIAPPPHYKRIDHHNELAHLPASIEQIAALLNVKLTRDQQLVAANDKGFIPALKAFGATDTEIQNIRQRDRAAQGVTEADEQKAVDSIQNQLIVRNGITVVQSETPKFSTITDRLFGKTNDHLLIFTEGGVSGDELCYYGIGKPLLERVFVDWLRKGHAYAGGGETGFFGFPNLSASKAMVNWVVEVLTEENDRGR
jgi:hypothetical protein